MAIEHSAISDAARHENKGVSTATADQVATANGSGATVWKKLTTVNLDTSSFFRTNKFMLTVVLPDISTASNIKVGIPVAATLNRVTATLQGAISGADAVLTVKNHSGGSAGTITVANSGSAAGDVDQLSPSANNTFTAGQVLTIETDGASTNTVSEIIILEFTQTA